MATPLLALVLVLLAGGAAASGPEEAAPVRAIDASHYSGAVDWSEVAGARLTLRLRQRARLPTLAR